MDGLHDNPVELVVAIFVARVVDVSLQTIRTMLAFWGHRYLAALIGFLETLLGSSPRARSFRISTRQYLAVAFAEGFAIGNIVGIRLESKPPMGTELLGALSNHRSVELAKQLRSQGQAVIELPGKGDNAPVEALLIVEKRKGVPALLRSIDSADPSAYYKVTDVKEGIHSLESASAEDFSVRTKSKRK